MGNYSLENYAYVFLSRVKTLIGLVLCEKLDGKQNCSCHDTLLKWEYSMKRKYEIPQLKLRGEYNRYKVEEKEFA